MKWIILIIGVMIGVILIFSYAIIRNSFNKDEEEIIKRIKEDE